MAAIMIKPVAGGRLTERGRRIAMVAGGPRLGRTPTSVPASAPKNAQNKFVGVRAAAKPSASSGSAPIVPSRPDVVVWQHSSHHLVAPEPRRQEYSQHPCEQPVGEPGYQHDRDDGADAAAALDSYEEGGHEKHHRRDEPDDRDQNGR